MNYSRVWTNRRELISAEGMFSLFCSIKLCSMNEAAGETQLFEYPDVQSENPLIIIQRRSFPEWVAIRFEPASRGGDHPKNLVLHQWWQYSRPHLSM